MPSPAGLSAPQTSYDRSMSCVLEEILTKAFISLFISRSHASSDRHIMFRKKLSVP